uniref:Ig-like domain-containing protein n=1 Tax=Chelonoidis abingdonii TaxID=106734 RepID=A0A8C0GS23_CHEAB
MLIPEDNQQEVLPGDSVWAYNTPQSQSLPSPGNPHPLSPPCDFTVTVRVAPEVVLVGQTVTLSCHLIGQVPANIQVHWYKLERNKNTTLYFYNSTEKGTELGLAGDRHRIKGRYGNGVIRVKLFPVQVEDNGQYVCAVTSDGVYQEAITQVTVPGKHGDVDTKVLPAGTNAALITVALIVHCLALCVAAVFALNPFLPTGRVHQLAREGETPMCVQYDGRWAEKVMDGEEEERSAGLGVRDTSAVWHPSHIVYANYTQCMHTTWIPHVTFSLAFCWWHLQSSSSCIVCTTAVQQQ